MSSSSILLRINNDYKNLVKLKNQSNGMFDFTVDQTHQNYKITLSGIESLVGEDESNYTKSNHHLFNLNLSPEYPLSPPQIKFKKTLFHPNWFEDGRVCIGEQWAPSDNLRDLIIDIVHMMTFETVNTSSPANKKANKWYLKNKNNIRNLIKRVQFPPPDDGRMRVYKEGGSGMIIYDKDDRLELL